MVNGDFCAQTTIKARAGLRLGCGPQRALGSTKGYVVVNSHIFVIISVIVTDIYICNSNQI